MMEEKKVCGVMNRGVISVRLEDSAAEISKILTGNSIHAVAVLDQRGKYNRCYFGDGSLTGIWSGSG